VVSFTPRLLYVLEISQQLNGDWACVRAGADVSENRFSPDRPAHIRVIILTALHWLICLRRRNKFNVLISLPGVHRLLSALSG